MQLLALDPGTDKTAFVLRENGEIVDHGIEENTVIRDRLCFEWSPHTVACEMVASYGMAVGREVFQTCVWVGRFQECVALHHGVRFRYVYRKDVKLHLCGSMRAKDSNIRQALLDKLGQQGTKKQPGPTYGIRSHEWAALAVAIYAEENPQ